MREAGRGRLIPLSELLERVIRDAGHHWLTNSEGNSANSISTNGNLHLSLVSTSGSRGVSAGHYSDPFFAIPLPDGNICVSDYGNHRLQVVCASGELVRTIGHQDHREGALVHPQGVAFSSHGLFVVDDMDRLQQYGSDALSPLSFRTRRFGGASQASELSHGKRFAQPATHTHLCGVAIGPSGRLYLTDRGQHRVLVLDEEGRVCFHFGQLGSEAGQLHDPRGLVVHASQVLYVRSNDEPRCTFCHRGQLPAAVHRPRLTCRCGSPTCATTGWRSSLSMGCRCAHLAVSAVLPPSFASRCASCASS